MKLFTLILAVFLSCISTAIMAYIAMAMPIGPWIETTLVLMGIIVFALIGRRYTHARTQVLGLSTAAGGIGGILATGLGFSLPAVYFLNPTLWAMWMGSPFYFAALIGGLAFAAGSFGLALAHLWEHKLIVEDQLPFPIGELIYKLISATNSMAKAIMLGVGFIGTQLLVYIQSYSSFIPSTFTVMPALRIWLIQTPAIVWRTELLPMFLAIGFVTGHMIAVPLLVGLLAKYFCLDPLYYVYTHAQVGHALTGEEFSVAFCSGLVLWGVIVSFWGLPKVIKKMVQTMSWDRFAQGPKSYGSSAWLVLVPGLVSTCIVLSYLHFSLLSQLYILCFTALWTYQVLVIAGKMGLAPLGRFATFVMVPGLLLFGLDGVQATLVATFVEITVGVASDVLFGRKMARMAHIERTSIAAYQWLGLLVSVLCIGLIMWLLIDHLGIGNGGELPVNKAYTRALLINVKTFDFLVLGMGLLGGFLLSFTPVSPALVLGGILMPPNYSLMLIAGGMLTYIVKDKSEYYPFWSGVFAANSLWMVIKTVIKSI